MTNRRHKRVGLVIGLAIIVALASAIIATAGEVGDSSLPGNDKVVRENDNNPQGKQAVWLISQSQAGGGRLVNQEVQTGIGFPYTAGGLLLMSISAGVALVAVGIGLKVLLSARR